MKKIGRRAFLGAAVALSGGGAVAQNTGANGLAEGGPAGSEGGRFLPPENRPAAPKAVLAYDAIAFLEKEIPHGKTPYGERYRVPIVGGRAEGPDIKARILPGGVDWQLMRADGYLVIEADYFMETDDGAPIHVVNRGLWHSATNDWPADYAVTTPVFEAPVGKYDWLNRYIFTGTVAPGPDQPLSVRLAVYKLV
ncbi:MAG: hypothetical protein CMI63_21415 [Parvularcula sp.]|nr:hypothetical protein [Parvularcula sp.]